jgi:vacuolar-type H+-ATPase subunit E/Vma4
MMSDEADRISKHIAELQRRNDELLKSNIRFEERARKAETQMALRADILVSLQNRKELLEQIIGSTYQIVGEMVAFVDFDPPVAEIRLLDMLSDPSEKTYARHLVYPRIKMF